MATFAYYFDGYAASRIAEVLLRTRRDPRFAAVARWHVSVVRGTEIGSGCGLFMRPDPESTWNIVEADGSRTDRPGYDWKSTDEPGLWFGLARKA